MSKLFYIRVQEEVHGLWEEFLKATGEQVHCSLLSVFIHILGHFSSKLKKIISALYFSVKYTSQYCPWARTLFVAAVYELSHTFIKANVKIIHACNCVSKVFALGLG